MMTSAELIADVALRMTLRDGQSARFSYRIPAPLQPAVQAGQLVWVPLRSQLVQGVVLTVQAGTRQQAGRLRAISSLADAEARIPPAGLELAYWLAATYRTTLYEALALLLPPGVSQAATITWQATPAGVAANLGALPERERAVLFSLRRQGTTTEDDLRQALNIGQKALREALALLHEQGLLDRSAAISAPRVRPRIERRVRLLLPAQQIAATLAELGRAPRQQAVLSWLDEQTQAAQPPETENENEADSEPDAPWLAASELYAATGADLGVLRALEQKGWLEQAEHELRRDPLLQISVPPDNPPPLTPAQRRVWEPLSQALDLQNRQQDRQQDRQEHSQVFLLHGVTGSGKTELYLRAAARVLRQGRQVLVLVPEIALTAQLVRRFAARFPDQLAVLHSQLASGERYDEWRRLRSGAARLAIGSRSVVFAPLPELGLIIVDEEHEPSYKQESSPRYHARDVALRLGELTGSLVLLGSATPSVESYHAAQSGRFQPLDLPERVGSAPGASGLPQSRPLPLPRVRLVDMRRELHEGNLSIFSRALQTALAGVLERGEQAILFLNRRGASSFVMCRDCGHILRCPQCNGPLVVHYAGSGDERQPAAGEPEQTLSCHSCTYRALLPACCPACLSPRVKGFGVGTQRVAAEVVQLFPHARSLRWDRDSASGKGAHDRLLDQFLNEEANVLVGTQMIAKGLDLPRVALVGVVAADTGLYLPDFRSGERTFQLLTQVAGRAGRRTAGAQVIIQTYTPDHYALRAAQEHDYRAFYVQEIAFRRELRYPPFARLVRFIYASSSTAACERESEALAADLRAIAARLHLADWSLIGPAPAFLRRMRGRWRWHLLLRAADPLPVLAELGPRPGWTIDVDPLYVL
jgi:primosomal protein N' (replication factor Y)